MTARRFSVLKTIETILDKQKDGAATNITFPSASHAEAKCIEGIMVILFAMSHNSENGPVNQLEVIPSTSTDAGYGLKRKDGKEERVTCDWDENTHTATMRLPHQSNPYRMHDILQEFRRHLFVDAELSPVSVRGEENMLYVIPYDSVAELQTYSTMAAAMVVAHGLDKDEVMLTHSEHEPPLLLFKRSAFEKLRSRESDQQPPLPPH